MKMVLAIVQADDANQIMGVLVNKGYRVTRVSTTGGWLRRENATLLMGVEDERVEDVLKLLRDTGQRRTVMTSLPFETTGIMSSEVFNVEIGGATVFVLDVVEHEHY